jgi:hypothetical protein
VHVKDGLVSKESLFLTDMLEEILEKLPAMLRSVSAGSIQVFIPDPDPDILPMPDPGVKKGTGSRILMSSTTPVVHIGLRISLPVFEKIGTGKVLTTQRLGGN